MSNQRKVLESKTILCSSFPFVSLVVNLYVPVNTIFVLKQHTIFKSKQFQKS